MSRSPCTGVPFSNTSSTGIVTRRISSVAPLPFRSVCSDRRIRSRALLGLATVNRERRRYDVAVPLYDRSLALMEKTFSREHPNVALAVHGRAVLEYEQHRYRDAEDLERRAIAIQERVLGPTHP